MEVNTIKQEEFEKIVRDFFAKSEFNNETIEKFSQIFIKYSRYDNIKEYCLNTIKEAYEYAANIKKDLEKTDFKEKEKEKIYDVMMKNSYLMDVGNVVVKSQSAIVKEHNDIVGRLNKTTVEKIKIERLRKESAVLKNLAEELVEVTKRTYKEATKARETINKRISKIEKKNNKRK